MKSFLPWLIIFLFIFSACLAYVDARLRVDFMEMTQSLILALLGYIAPSPFSKSS